MTDKTDKTENEMEQLLESLQLLHSEKEELEDYLQRRFRAEREEQAACQARIDEAVARRDELEAKMRDSDPQLFLDLATAERDIAHKEAEIKRFCHSLNVSKYGSGAVFRSAGLKVSVSRATVQRTYRSGLLEKHPELENMYVDGDPVVVKTIDAAVLDRLVAEEKFDAKEAAEFLDEEKIRNPQVRIRTDDSDGDEDDSE